MDIDAVIAEATSVAEQAQASPEAKTEITKPQEQVSPEYTGETEESKETQIKADSELTPEQLAKREANRQSHLNSKLAKMRRENRELREAVERIQPQKAQAQPAANQNTPPANGSPVKPVESNFQTWGEYLDAKDAYYEALADWKVEQKLSERDTKQTETAKQQQDNAKTYSRIQEVAAQEQEFAKANPEYTALYEQHSDFMNNLPLPVAHALMEADNASLALYALMKEGNLESLEEMSPYKISMEIGKAELRGESYLNRNKATNAPAPMTPARGTASTGKSLENKSVEELLKQFNTR